MSPMNEYTEKSISIQELFGLLKRYLLVIVAAGLVGGMIAYCICSFCIAPIYEASAKMIINSRPNQSGTVTNDQITSAQKLADTYAVIICSQPVLEPVIDALDLKMDVDNLASKVTVTSVNDTQVIKIAVQMKDPKQAMQIVEQIINTCPAIIIDAVEAGSVKTIEPPRLNKQPVVPKTNLATVVTALLSMVVTVIVVILCFMLDNTYKSEIDLRNDLDLPVLGVIPDYECCLKKEDEGKGAKYYGKK